MQTSEKIAKAQEYLMRILVPLCDENIDVEATEDENGFTFLVRLGNKDLPLLIGKGGITAESIRQLLTVYGIRNKVFIKFSIP